MDLPIRSIQRKRESEREVKNEESKDKSNKEEVACDSRRGGEKERQSSERVQSRCC